MLLGGRGLRGTTSAIGALSLTAVTAPSTTTAAPGGNVYSNDGPNMLSPAVRGVPLRIYVPNTKSNTVDVIDPGTGRVIRHFAVGGQPQHVTPSWDLKTLFVLNDQGDSVTPIDPVTSRPGRPSRSTIRTTCTSRRTGGTRSSWPNAQLAGLPGPAHDGGPPLGAGHLRWRDHIDFSADGRHFLASCEFSGDVLEVDVAVQRGRAGTVHPPASDAMPQDVKLSPTARYLLRRGHADRRAVWT